MPSEWARSSPIPVSEEECQMARFGSERRGNCLGGIAILWSWMAALGSGIRQRRGDQEAGRVQRVWDWIDSGFADKRIHLPSTVVGRGMERRDTVGVIRLLVLWPRFGFFFLGDRLGLCGVSSEPIAICSPYPGFHPGLACGRPFGAGECPEGAMQTTHQAPSSPGLGSGSPLGTQAAPSGLSCPDQGWTRTGQSGESVRAESRRVTRDAVSSGRMGARLWASPGSLTTW